MVAEVSLGSIFDAFSVPATVRPPGADSIETSGVWVSSSTDGAPSGFGVQRREARDVFALRRDEVPEIKRGTVIVAPPYGSTVLQRWRVDGFEVIEADCLRVVVVPDPQAEPPEPTSWIQGGWIQ